MLASAIARYNALILPNLVKHTAGDAPTLATLGVVVRNASDHEYPFGADESYSLNIDIAAALQAGTGIRFCLLLTLFCYVCLRVNHLQRVFYDINYMAACFYFSVGRFARAGDFCAASYSEQHIRGRFGPGHAGNARD